MPLLTVASRRALPLDLTTLFDPHLKLNLPHLQHSLHLKVSVPIFLLVQSHHLLQFSTFTHQLPTILLLDFYAVQFNSTLIITND